MPSIKTPSIEKPAIKIDSKTKKKLQEHAAEESQVIIHCTYAATYGYDWIRIWKTTFLFDKGSDHKSKLLLAENIPLYPVWKEIGIGETLYFTLIFSALPKSCKVFDMIEKIPEHGGFEFKNIRRNKTDVYHIDLP